MLPYQEGAAGWDRVGSAATTGIMAGAAVGAVRGTWDLRSARQTRHESTLSGMGKSATKLGATVLLFAGVACTYAATEAVLEGFRGKGDWKNGAVGGLLAGSLFGLRAGSIHTAATSGLLLSAVSISGDIMNGQLRTNIFSDDPRPSNPYATKLSLPKA